MRSLLAYIGSRTTRERQARGEGITVCRVEDDGRLTPIQVLGDLVNPSFLALNRRGDRLYSVHGDGDACSVFAVAPHDGTLTHLQTQDCGACNPVHLALDMEEARLFVSSHLTGELLSMPVLADGTLGAVTQRVAMTGEPGPHRVEQPFAKPHHNPLDPSGRWVVVPDKGLDRLFVFDTQGGQGGVLAPAASPHVEAREGAGPRHVAFHPSGRWLFCVNELDASVTVYAFDAGTGTLTPLQWHTLMPDTWMPHSRGAEIEVSLDGRTLYASHRGADRIEVFAIDANPDTGSGRLTHLQSRPSEGRTPRFFALHPQGGFLYVLNEDSDTVVTLAIDPEDGRLGECVAMLRCGSPVCLVFTRPASPRRP